MLNPKKRATIVQLQEKGLSTRRIARLLKISRPAVSRVIAEIALQTPTPLAQPYRDEMAKLQRALPRR